MKRLLVIPAAGLGTRLKSDSPKVLYKLGGRTMLDRLLEMYRPHAERVVVVAHPSFAGRVREHCKQEAVEVRVALQERPDGMLPAILAAREEVVRAGAEEIWITWCDQVGIRPGTLAKLSGALEAAAMALPVWRKPEPYIHFDRDAAGRLCGVRQRREGDDMPETGEGDCGLFALRRETYTLELTEYAERQERGARTGELNFLPFIPWLARRAEVTTFNAEEEMETVGVNTPEEAQAMEEYLRSHE